MRLINIGITDIILQNYEDGQGKIIISNFDFDYNFSFYWGSMGQNTNIEQFLCEINSSYFVDKLSARINGVLDSKKTFSNFRRYIREEIMQWFQYVEFQKDMRYKLNDFQTECYDERQFVQMFTNFCDHVLDYSLIDDWYDEKEIKSSFTGICEPWNFIVNKPPRENIWLEKLHVKLKKELKAINNSRR